MGKLLHGIGMPSRNASYCSRTLGSLRIGWSVGLAGACVLPRASWGSSWVLVKRGEIDVAGEGNVDSCGSDSLEPKLYNARQPTRTRAPAYRTKQRCLNGGTHADG